MMLLQAGLIGEKYRFSWHKSYNHFHQSDLLQWKGNRKSPGFCEEPAKQLKVMSWFKDQLHIARANVALVMDPALFFMVNPDWDQATPEKLRGGVYNVLNHDRSSIIYFVTVPISNINRSVKQRDIAAINQGFDDREEFESVYGSDDDDDDDPDSEVNQMEWYDPITVPYGKFCFQSDMHKLGRILRKAEAELENGSIRQITTTR